MAWTIVSAGTADYEATRRSLVWQARVPHRYPDVIYRPSSATEVAELVGEVIPADQRISVRSGGHNWLGASLRQGGALLDLGGLSHVMVDVDSRTAVIGPGATNQMVADALTPLGLAFPIGHCPSVGLGGYLLAGGMGWNLHEWGLGADNVIGADVVLADGTITPVTADREPELFWALRGGSTGFPGIVTSFAVRVKPMPQIRSRTIIHPIDELPTLLGKLAGYLPANAGTEIALIVRRPLWNRALAPITTVACTTFGEIEEKAVARLERVVAELDLARGAIRDTGILPVAFNELEGEGGWTGGLRYHADTAWASAPAESIGKAVADSARTAPSVESRTVIAFAHSPQRHTDMAYTRFGDMTVNFYATWREEAGDSANIDWVRASTASLGSLIQGHYIGESDLGAAPDRLALSYPDTKLRRLDTIIRTYDPACRLHNFLSMR